VLPLIGGGTRLQPVFVEDVAEAIANIVTDPRTVGQTYELAGPGVYTLRELVNMTLRIMGKRRLLVPVPFAVAESKRDCSSSCPTRHSPRARLIFSKRIMLRAVPCLLRELNIGPKTVEKVVPTYIEPLAPGRR
jgi:nucleoside-diphosphate-sugar epimerase